MYVISYLLPVNGRHFLFPTYPDVGQYIPTSLSMLPDSENMSIAAAVGISLQSCVSAAVRKTLSAKTKTKF